MLIDRHIATGGHIVHLAIEQSTEGWDVREELDAKTVHVEHHEDWHRVERAMDRLEREVRHGVFAVAAHH
ncbi:MAG TPA: hypothetical protein VLV86_24440 [Vicinamibacterales bacterium]|nr:hypothetical protein [Vicinamibacterales bacterium]